MAAIAWAALSARCAWASASLQGGVPADAMDVAVSDSDDLVELAMIWLSSSQNRYGHINIIYRYSNWIWDNKSSWNMKASKCTRNHVNTNTNREYQYEYQHQHQPYQQSVKQIIFSRSMFIYFAMWNLFVPGGAWEMCHMMMSHMSILSPFSHDDNVDT